jgi:nitrite reductase (NO-forming)
MRHSFFLVGLGSLAVIVAGCGSPQPTDAPAAGSAQTGEPSVVSSAGGPSSEPLITENQKPVAGQQKTCSGPREKSFNIDVVETTVDLGLGTTFAAWTYDGKIPGPTLEACEGDDVTIVVNNKGTTSHGLDTHAFKIDARKYGPTAPGTSMTIKKIVDTPGVFMYHCAAGPVTDLHIKSGVHGAMIVYPRAEVLRPAREIVVVEDAVYGARDAKGFIPGSDPARTQKNDQLFSMFNGRLEHAPVQVNPGDLVRMYFVNVGPWVSAAHAIGTVLDRVYDGQTPIHGVQTYAVPSGSGAIFEFYIPEPGVYPFVDHDKLAFLPTGLALAFATVDVPGAAH